MAEHRFKVGDRVEITERCEVAAGIPKREIGKLATVLPYDEILTDEGTTWAFGGTKGAIRLAAWFIDSDGVKRFNLPADTSPTADPVVEQRMDDLRVLKKCRGCGKDANTLQAWNDQAGNRFCSKSCCEGWSTKTAGRLLIGVDPAFGAPESVKSWASRVNDESVAASMRQRDLDSGATARLVAALAAEHTRQADSSRLLHPKEFWSGRRGGRRNG